MGGGATGGNERRSSDGPYRWSDTLVSDDDTGVR